MNYSDYNPFELAPKLIPYQLNDGVRNHVDNISKVKTLVHVGQLYNQIEYYQRTASFASLCPPSNDRSKILEQCNHGINDCYNELERLAKETIMDRVIERYANMRRQRRY